MGSSSFRKAAVTLLIVLGSIGLLLVLLVAGMGTILINHSRHYYDGMTRVCPKSSDMAGDYAVTTDKSSNHPAVIGKVVLRLREDGTFVMESMPGCIESHSADGHITPLQEGYTWSGRGHWEVVPLSAPRLSGESQGTVYGLSLGLFNELVGPDTGERYERHFGGTSCINILGSGAPYRLRFLIGDPDNYDSNMLLLERVNTNQPSTSQSSQSSQ